MTRKHLIPEIFKERCNKKHTKMETEAARLALTEIEMSENNSAFADNRFTVWRT
jgi:hypothetical protein